MNDSKVVEAVPLPDTSALAGTMEALQRQAAAVVITDDVSYQDASAFLVKVVTEKKRRVEMFEPAKKATHAGWKSVCDLVNAATDPLQKIEDAIKPKIGKWIMDEKRRLALEEQKRQAEAKARAEAEQVEEALAHEQAGEKEAAMEVISRPVYVAPVSQEAPKAKGIAVPMVKVVRIIDASKVKRAFLMPNEKLITDTALAVPLDVAKDLIGDGAFVIEEVPRVSVRRS